MADKTIRVDPDNIGSPNYTSCYDAMLGEAAANPDLVTLAGNLIVELDSGAGSADTTAFTINGFTVSSAYHIKFKPYAGQAHVGTYDATKARIELTDTTDGVYNNEAYTEFSHMQLKVTASSGGVYGGFYAQGANSKITECIMQAVQTNGTINLISIGAGDQIITDNVLFEPTGAGSRGIYNGTAGTVIENNTIDGFYYGMDLANSPLAKNNAVINATKCFNGTYAVGSDYNADDGDASAPGANSLHTLATTDFVNYAGHDYSINNTSVLYASGVTISGLTTDILGNTFGSPPSIGAFEYISAGTTFNPAIALMANQ